MTLFLLLNLPPPPPPSPLLLLPTLIQCLSMTFALFFFDGWGRGDAFASPPLLPLTSLTLTLAVLWLGLAFPWSECKIRFSISASLRFAKYKFPSTQTYGLQPKLLISKCSGSQTMGRDPKWKEKKDDVPHSDITPGSRLCICPVSRIIGCFNAQCHIMHV